MQKVKYVFRLFLLQGTCAIIFSCVDNKREQICIGLEEMADVGRATERERDNWEIVISAASWFK